MLDGVAENICNQKMVMFAGSRKKVRKSALATRLNTNFTSVILLSQFPVIPLSQIPFSGPYICMTYVTYVYDIYDLKLRGKSSTVSMVRGSIKPNKHVNFHLNTGPLDNSLTWGPGILMEKGSSDIASSQATRKFLMHCDLQEGI